MKEYFFDGARLIESPSNDFLAAMGIAALVKENGLLGLGFSFVDQDKIATIIVEQPIADEIAITEEQLLRTRSEPSVVPLTSTSTVIQCIFEKNQTTVSMREHTYLRPKNFDEPLTPSKISEPETLAGERKDHVARSTIFHALAGIMFYRNVTELLIPSQPTNIVAFPVKPLIIEP